MLSDLILLIGSTAYIAAAGEGQMRMVDVSDPSQPRIVSSFSPSGWTRQEGRTLNTFEGTLYFGRTSGGFDITTDHELFTWPDASQNPLPMASSTNIPGGVYGIIPDRKQTFIFTRSGSLPFQPQSATCDGRRMYILSHKIGRAHV